MNREEELTNENHRLRTENADLKKGVELAKKAAESGLECVAVLLEKGDHALSLVLEFLESHATYEGGGKGGTWTIVFKTQVDSESFDDQLADAVARSQKSP